MGILGSSIRQMTGHCEAVIRCSPFCFPSSTNTVWLATVDRTVVLGVVSYGDENSCSRLSSGHQNQTKGKNIWKTIRPLLKNLRPSVYVPWFLEITTVNCGKSMSTLISISLLYIKYHIGCLGSFS